MTINVNVDLLGELADKQKQELADELYDFGFIPTELRKENVGSDFDKLVSKIIGNKHKLTIDEERIICEIAERIVL